MKLMGRVSGGAVACALVLTSFSALQAQSLQDHKERIAAAIERNDDRGAVTELRSLQKTDRAVFALNNYDYLLARLSQRGGDRASATQSYQSVVLRRSALNQYALWHLAEIARASGNLTLERQQLRQLIASAPSSLYRSAAEIRLGQSFFESADYPATIAALRRISDTKASPTARAALSLIGQAYLRSKQNQAARDTFYRLITEATDPSRPDDYSLAAARALDELDCSSELKLAEPEHLRRANIYQFNRDFSGARRHYQAIVEAYPASKSVPDSLYQIGRGLFQEAKYDEAIAAFQQVMTKSAGSGSARDALGMLAGAQNRLKRTDDAIASYKQLIDRYPDAPNPERPYLNIIDALHEAGRHAEALAWVRQMRERFPGQLAATLALFSQARIHLAQGAWADVLADVAVLQKERDLGGALTSGSTNAAELAFLRAYGLEQSGRIGEAVEAYVAIPDGRSEYYGGQATLRLRALARLPEQQSLMASTLQSDKDSVRRAFEAGDYEQARAGAQAGLRLTEDTEATRELLDIARRAYANLPAYNSFPALSLVPIGRQEMVTGATDIPITNENEVSHQKLADELLFLGLYDEGAPELAAARLEKAGASNAANDPTGSQTKTAPPNTSGSAAPASSLNMQYTLAVSFMRGGNANQALRFATPLWRNVPRDYLLQLAPRQLAELLYPAPHIPALLANAPSRGVDPRFLLAIARQESAFLPEAKSASAARGMMQFISATAADIARQLGKPSFRDEELYDPAVSILFGAQYISNLFKRFPGMPQAVAASYNGGDDNVARWIARARSNDPDRYVPEIAFAQSKDYVYRVMANYRAYQTLYSDQLLAR
ncbi:MAG: transglycosylase SLT domain-containing protein [Pyrinomonadaceae bacterium]